jgi:hypothetical protein
MVRLMLKGVGFLHGRPVPQAKMGWVMLGAKKPHPGVRVYVDLVDGGKSEVGKLTWNSELCCWEFHVKGEYRGEGGHVE